MPSELFGHEKGAFTGAGTRYLGSFEQAQRRHGFFWMKYPLSPKRSRSVLLRLLEAKEFYRIGGREAIQSDVRVIAASNEDLQEAVERNLFRNDLYFRLEVLQIHMPPLRERHGDMLLLMEHFINLYSRVNGKNILGVSPECLRLLSSYEWPGNVRELKNVVLRAVVHCQGDILLPEHLTSRIIHGNPKLPTVHSAHRQKPWPSWSGKSLSALWNSRAATKNEPLKFWALAGGRFTIKSANTAYRPDSAFPPVVNCMSQLTISLRPMSYNQKLCMGELKKGGVSW